MESLKKNKTLLIVFSLSCVGFLLYQFSGVFKSAAVSMVETSSVDEATTSEILTLLSQMQQAKIDSELFTSTVWNSLVDYSVPLPTDAPGRPDLFGTSLQSASVAGSLRP